MSKTIIFLLLLCLCAYCKAQPFEIPLGNGSYTVGFKAYWKFDHSRLFNPSGVDSTIKTDHKIVRPVLIYVWYPAEKHFAIMSMKYGKYLLPPQDSSLPRGFIRSFTDYNRKVSVSEIFGKEEAKLDASETSLLKKILETKTKAISPAKPINKKFPLIIYHQGNGASMDDNILLCEFLASHGYIVISSSFFHEGGEVWGVDGRMGSVRDISFILSNAGVWEPNADINQSAIVGHSAGAQASHIAMAQGNLVFKAMVSLETTQEYHTLASKLWKTFINPTLEGINKVRGDLLFITKPAAIFQLADSMKNANRYYYTIPEVSHNDFISQGVIHNYVKRETKKEEKGSKNFSTVAADYKGICLMILSFLDAKLKKDARAFEAYYQKGVTCATTKTGCMEIMPAGKTKPESYNKAGEPPSVRQFRQLLSASPSTAIDALKRFYKTDSSLTIFDFAFAFAIIDELVEVGKTRDAGLVYTAYKELLGQPFIDDYKWKCSFYNMVSGQPQDACDKRLKVLTGE